MLKKEKKDVDITFFITTKEALNSHLKLMLSLRIDPDYVSAASMALVRFVKSIETNISSAVIINIGKSQTTCVLMHKNMPKASHALNIAALYLLEALSKDNLNFLKEAEKLDLDQIKEKDFPNLFKSAIFLRKEITKIIFSFFDKDSFKKMPLVLTGEIQSFLNLHNFLLSDTVFSYRLENN